MPSLCATCKKSNASAVCGRCKCTYYCNQDCQRKHWKQHKKICKCTYYCNQDCQRKHWKQHKKICKSLLKTKDINTQNNVDVDTTNDDQKQSIHFHPSNKWFRIEKVQGKGLGMIAKKDIRIGTMIIKEYPIISLARVASMDLKSSNIDDFNKKYAKPLMKSFNKLSANDQKLYKSLSSKHDGSVLDIFLNNCLTNQSNDFDGVYPTISRCNHSCNPNTARWIQYNQTNNKYNARLIVVKKIKKNEEITTNYMGEKLLLYNERKEELMNGWKINKCDCNWCSSINIRKDIDKAIIKYNNLDDNILKINEYQQKYTLCKSMIQLIKNKFDSNPQLLFRHSWDLAQTCLYCFKQTEFIDNLVNTVKYKYLAHGKDSGIPDDVQEYIDMLPTPQVKYEVNERLKALLH